MKDKLMNYHPRALRKYISEYNKEQRADISKKIKEKRKDFSEKMKAERKGQKILREIKIPKGIKKEGLVKLVMSRASMKIKAENDFKNKTAFEGYEFKGDVLQPQGLKAKKEKPATKPAPKKKEPKPADTPVKKVSVERLNRIRKKVKDLGKKEVEKKKKLADEIEKVAKDLKIKKARAGKKPAKKEKPPADEAKRIPKMLAIIEEGRKKGVPVKGLETQIRELRNKFDLSDFEGGGPAPKAPPAPKKTDIKTTDIKKIFDEKGLKFTRYSRDIQNFYDRETGKTSPRVKDIKLTDNNRTMILRGETRADGPIKLFTFSVNKIGEKIAKAPKRKVEVRKAPVRVKVKEAPKIKNDSFSKIISDNPEVASIEKKPNSLNIEILTKKGARVSVSKQSEIFKRVRDIVEPEGKNYSIGSSVEPEKSKPAPKPKAPPKEETDDEDETPDPPVKEIPKNLYKVWKFYMQERVGDYYSKSDQKEEIDVFKDLQKDYLKNDKIRKDKKQSAANQSKARNALARIREDMDNDFKLNSNIKKLYQLFAPKLVMKYDDFQKEVQKSDEEFEKELAEKERKIEEEDQKRIARIKAGSKAKK